MLRVSWDKALLALGQGQRAPTSSVVSILVGCGPIYDAEAPRTNGAFSSLPLVIFLQLVKESKKLNLPFQLLN